MFSEGFAGFFQGFKLGCSKGLFGSSKGFIGFSKGFLGVLM